VLLEGFDEHISNSTEQVNMIASNIATALSEEYVLGIIRHHGSASLGIKIFKDDEVDPGNFSRKQTRLCIKQKKLRQSDRRT